MNTDLTFITNEGELLSEVVNNILPSSSVLSFLVGYFYFSGFEEIYHNLEDKHLRILVGMDIGKSLKKKIIEYEILDELTQSRGEVKQEFYKSFIELINDSDFFDSKKMESAFRIFIEKLKNGTLEIKKTILSNHAKLYIFQKKPEFSESGSYPGAVITGSSNLTRQGLKGQFEINVVFREKTIFNEALNLFNKLWNESVSIVDKFNLEEFLTNVVDKIWIDKLPKPFLMFIRILVEYFNVSEPVGIRLPGEITRSRYLNLKYQTDAISQAISIIKKHNGVIIADVVGLGKSIIASAIAYNLNLKTIIIARPHLLPQWKDYYYEFNLVAKVYSSGVIEQALIENDDVEEKLIIIDEAHQYRNEATIDYVNLQKLCMKNKVILLTATPFNNRPQDIFALIKLFQIPTKSTIQTVDNLSYQFRELSKEYKKIKDEQKKKKIPESEIKQLIDEIADKIRDIISPIVIRRSRIDLDNIEEYKKDLKNQNIDFNKVNPPELLDYELGELSELYINTLNKIAPGYEDGGFIGARYKPTLYIKNIDKYKSRIAKELNIDENLLKQTQINLADFMKRLLVHRFESSVYAFKSTLDNFIKSTEVIKDWYERLGKVPVYKRGKLPDVDTLLYSSGEDLSDAIEDINLEIQLAKYYEQGLMIIEKKELRNQFIEDINKDLELLYEIKQEWFHNGIPYDPKLEGLKIILSEKIKENPERKIIIFSEYVDTVNYLYEKLKDDYRVIKYTAKDSNYNYKNLIKRNFDAGLPEKEQSDDYDILVASDAISEGYNLHRAGIVFNYDIPYNPTRVIQRVGRINRINKKVFDELFIYNYFPSATGESQTRVKGISTLKISMIHALIGEDTQFLTKDEDVRSFFIEQYKNLAKEEEEKASWDVEYRNILNNIISSRYEIVKKAEELPKRVKIRRTKEKGNKGVIVFGKKGPECVFKLSDSIDDIKTLKAKDALSLFEAGIDEDAEPVSGRFDNIYQSVKKNLFTRKTQTAMDSGKREALAKIEYLIAAIPEKRDYLNDLKRALKEYDALNENFLRLIRSISSERLTEDIKELEKLIPHKHLMNIVKKAESIDEAEEIVILAEELI